MQQGVGPPRVCVHMRGGVALQAKHTCAVLLCNSPENDSKERLDWARAPLRKSGVSMCTKGSGTNSVSPPVRCCSSRRAAKCLAQDAGPSQCPNMMVDVVRRPTVRVAGGAPRVAVRLAKERAAELGPVGQRPPALHC